MSNVGETIRRGLESLIATREPADELSPEEEKQLKDVMDVLEPELDTVAKDLLREEIKDKLRRNPDKIRILKKQIAKGKKPSLKRKVGCIFIQTGDGSPTDPIEEVLLAST